MSKKVKCANCGMVYQGLWCPKCKSVVNVPNTENDENKGRT